METFDEQSCQLREEAGTNWDFQVIICCRKLFDAFCLRLRSLYIIILCFFLSYFKKNVFQGRQRDTVTHDADRFKISVEVLKERAKLVRKELRNLKSDHA